MKIAITGGRGFIGSATADAAEAQGHEVSFFDRRTGHDIMGDLSDLAGADAVIHLAGLIGTMELFDDIEQAVMVNTIGSLRVMQWCLTNDAQYVGILVPDVFPSVYCATKVGAQRLSTALHHAKGLKVSHVRAFNIHGPGQATAGNGHPRKFGPTFSVAGWRNEPIPVWGDGTNKVDLCTARDCGRMLVDACRFGNDEIFDAGTGTEVSVKDLAEFVIRVTGSTAGIEYQPMRIGETPTNVAAKGEGWDLLDWRPSFSWSDLAETVQWYRDRPEVKESGTR